jgi:hypothetical protein
VFDDASVTEWHGVEHRTTRYADIRELVIEASSAIGRKVTDRREATLGLLAYVVPEKTASAVLTISTEGGTVAYSVPEDATHVRAKLRGVPIGLPPRPDLT